MMRPAVWRFGGLGAAMFVACWTGSAPTTVANRASTGHDLTGPYRCSISESGYDYPPFPCVIRNDGDRTMLVKLEGSQRFEGEIVVDGEGFRFSGRYFCPRGDCTQELHGTFVRVRDGVGYRGTFSDDPNVVVWLVPGALRAGGASYGGFGYGGSSYGYSGKRTPSNRRP
jgi:hypothetical protein